ncbi:hypothetical protein DERP_012160 [Dermatophagoides pteronyssinus]|uniref:Uncharacterized protein n=1 Tax=Dermatophagoides pteronyssinus TaxID=6956 RepID=A0ABQ8J2A5_DERPT|nr:hypothetical protein DERP_012160 [Dermatophagoides pteronyssinus]
MDCKTRPTQCDVVIGYFGLSLVYANIITSNISPSVLSCIGDMTNAKSYNDHDHMIVNLVNFQQFILNNRCDLC